VTARALSDGRVEAHFAVSDTGIGISHEELGRLFIAFQQLDGSLARKHGGTGLGLAISKSLAELMGGEIWAESTPGEGSTFHFTIVGEAAPAPPPRAAHAGHTGRSEARNPLRILVAEDHPMNRRVMLGLLEHLGYGAEVAGNGREALEALARRRYDVVLMDVQMPEMDGLETTRRIRRQLPADRQPRIFALTAHAMPGDRERCLEAGMDGYLSKPVQIAALEAALEATSSAVETLPPDPLDRQILDLLRGLPAAGGESFLSTVIRSFLASSADDLATVRRCAEEGRWPEAGRAAHRLKGSSATLGAARVAAACAAIEEKAREEQAQDLAPLIARLEQELTQAHAALGEAAREPAS
jgi:CheY-like chemotaxis protein